MEGRAFSPPRVTSLKLAPLVRVYWYCRTGTVTLNIFPNKQTEMSCVDWGVPWRERVPWFCDGTTVRLEPTQVGQAVRLSADATSAGHVLTAIAEIRSFMWKYTNSPCNIGLGRDDSSTENHHNWWRMTAYHEKRIMYLSSEEAMYIVRYFVHQLHLLIRSLEAIMTDDHQAILGMQAWMDQSYFVLLAHEQLCEQGCIRGLNHDSTNGLLLNFVTGDPFEQLSFLNQAEPLESSDHDALRVRSTPPATSNSYSVCTEYCMHTSHISLMNHCFCCVASQQPTPSDIYHERYKGDGVEALRVCALLSCVFPISRLHLPNIDHINHNSCPIASQQATGTDHHESKLRLRGGCGNTRREVGQLDQSETQSCDTAQLVNHENTPPPIEQRLGLPDLTLTNLDYAVLEPRIAACLHTIDITSGS